MRLVQWGLTMDQLSRVPNDDAHDIRSAFSTTGNELGLLFRADGGPALATDGDPLHLGSLPAGEDIELVLISRFELVHTQPGFVYALSQYAVLVRWPRTFAADGQPT